MTLYVPSKEWAGQDAILVGGGASLQRFDLNLLKGRNTIGCNEAVMLGPEIIHTVLFADIGWFHKRKWDLEAFAKRGGRIVSLSDDLHHLNLPWIHKMRRQREGFCFNGTQLALNRSTGAAAINLAYRLGAARIFLLGYDLKCEGRKSHWHSHYSKITSQESFARFAQGFKEVALQLNLHAENVDVVNVSDDSNLKEFRMITLDQFKEHLREHNQENATPESSLLAEVRN